MSTADSAELKAACATASNMGPAELRRCQARLLPEIVPQRTPGSGIDQREIAGPRATPLPPALPPPNELARADLLELQELLAAVGQNPGRADGLFGPATARAITQYEQGVGRAATGRATLALLEQLRASQPEQETAAPERQLAEPEWQIAEPAEPVPAVQPAPSAPLPALPDEPNERLTSLSRATPQAPVPRQAEGSLPAEIFLQSKGTIWLVIAGENIAAFENPSDLSLGAAVAVAPDRLLTSCRVIEDLEIISIWQGDFFASAELLNADLKSDLCLLVPNKMELSATAGVRRYDELDVGERVFAVGSPSGLQQTLGEGLISSVRVDDGLPLIQTTAPIRSGASGGGLFDDRGRLIGITTSPLQDGQQLNLGIATESLGID